MDGNKDGYHKSLVIIFMAVICHAFFILFAHSITEENGLWSIIKIQFWATIASICVMCLLIGLYSFISEGCIGPTGRKFLAELNDNPFFRTIIIVVGLFVLIIPYSLAVFFILW